MKLRTVPLAGSGNAPPAYLLTTFTTSRIVCTTSLLIAVSVCKCSGDGDPEVCAWSESIKFRNTRICWSICAVAYCSHCRQYFNRRILSSLNAAPIPPTSSTIACHRLRCTTCCCCCCCCGSGCCSCLGVGVRLWVSARLDGSSSRRILVSLSLPFQRSGEVCLALLPRRAPDDDPSTEEDHASLFSRFSPSGRYS